MKKVVIIGAGFGGLSAAAFLAKEGFQVHVVEKNSQPGGRAMTWQKDGFTFDMGPSWYTMPDIFEHFFKQFNKKPSDYYTLKRLDPSYKVFFGKNDTLNVPAALEEVYKLFDSLEPNGSEKLKRFLAQAKYQYDVSVESFLYKEYRTIFDMFDKRMIKEGNKLHLFDTMDSFTKRYFTNEKTRKLLQYTLVFLGGSPKRTPAIYALMAYIDYSLGIWYPMGGMSQVVNGIYTLAKEMGATFSFNQDVTAIEVINSKATKIITNKRTFDADIVVSNADYAYTELHLLNKKYQSYPKSYWEKKTIAPSAFLLYLGLNTKIKHLSHHNLLLHNDWTEHFESIFDKPAWPDKPSYYINCPSITDKTVAPKGKEAVFILVPISSGIKDTPAIRNAYTEKILKDIEHVIDFPIRKHIEVKRIFSLNDYESLYHAYKGTALGLSHTLMQTAIFRPKQRSSKVSNLFYTGQFTHPGIGMPVTLISSHIIRDILKKEYAD